MDEAWQHIFGFCILNGRSGRDSHVWEYQPLGPFPRKSFGTNVSPWIVTAEVLLPFRVTAFPRDEQDPRPLPHLHAQADKQSGASDIDVRCALRAAGMTAALTVSPACTRGLYWTPVQFVTHQTSNGCNLETGDLLGSGTVSGTTLGSPGSPLEITACGHQAV
ncbi:fumarylacetoacetate hydrolase family protein [Bradyrhizobium sp. SSUT112]|uniref:fumarylacetoacetate hydrolase family protein n=1 Tax=Bradyrhizobium sp. SSUT112 TaxID=3040604 RepID=UPI0032632EF0